MKAVLVFLLVAAVGVAVVQSAPQKRDVAASSPDLATAVMDILKAYKHIMPCGDAETNLPAMEPFRLPIVSLDINHELLVLNGSIKNMVVTGLSEFVVVELSTNATNSRTTFDVIFKDIQLLGDYSLYVNADLAGYKFVVNLLGLMNLHAMDFRVNGGLTLGTNAAGGILVSDVEYYIEVGNVVSHVLDYEWSLALNEYFNMYVHNTVLLWMASHREFLNERFSAYITTKLNEAWSNISLAQLTQNMVDISDEWNSVSCTP